MSSSSNPNPDALRSTALQVLLQQGLQIRSEVTGPSHVQKSWESCPEFSRPIQELAMQVGWAMLWGRPAADDDVAAASSSTAPTATGTDSNSAASSEPKLALDRRTRSLINLAMLTALGKSQELGVHVRAAARNGCTEAEMQEALLQAAVYAGLPAGLDGFRVAQRVVDEMRAETEAAKTE